MHKLIFAQHIASHFLPLLLSSIALSATATSSVSSGIQFPRSRSAHIGVIVRDLATGDNVVEQNPDKFLTPASILKCVTAASVLLDGKADTVFTTQVFTLGDIDNVGTLYGNLVIKASGDPTIESHNFCDTHGFIEAIVGKIRHNGIRNINGSLEIDSVGFVQPGPVDRWEYDDLKYAYGAGLYPLNYNDNTINGDRALGDPGEEFLIALEERFDTDSIDVTWNEVNVAHMQPRPLLTHTSPSARQIMRIMMEKSVNLYAECMLRLLLPGNGREAALARQLQLLDKAGIDTDAAQIFDGSGLTRANRITPDFMADLLETMANSELRDSYIGLFPCVGREGTVRRLLCDTPLEGRLVLKSGSMNGVQTYAGYMLDNDDKPTHVVVIMINDFTCKRAAVTKAISAFLLQQFKK